MNFSALKEELHRLGAECKIPGCAMTVHIGRETVFEDCLNVRPDDLFWLYSATKVFTATMFCRLLEQGRLRLEERVSDYLPEFANLSVMQPDGTLRKATEEMTLLQLITMCSAMTYDIFHPVIRDAKDRTTVGIVREMAKMPLVDDPGETYLYSLSHDVLAAVMELRTGKRYADLLRDEIILPLGMEDTCFHPTEAQKKRFAPQFRWKGMKDGGAEPCPRTNKFCFSEDYDSGGAGLCSTLRDYILLPEALSNGGLGRDGYPLLKPETIEEMRLDRLTEKQRIGFDERWVRLRSYGYGLGVRTRLNQSDGSLAPQGEFGWDGAAGAYVLIDPSRNLSAFYVQHVLDMGYVFDVIHPRLRERVYLGLEA